MQMPLKIFPVGFSCFSYLSDKNILTFIIWSYRIMLQSLVTRRQTGRWAARVSTLTRGPRRDRPLPGTGDYRGMLTLCHYITLWGWAEATICPPPLSPTWSCYWSLVSVTTSNPRVLRGFPKVKFESKKAHLDCMWSFDKRMLPDKPEMTKKNREANISYAN